MDHFTTLILLFSGLSSISCYNFPYRKYFYYTEPKTAAEAQLYCREHHTDLAIFESQDEINQLNQPADVSFAWIGLFDHPEAWLGTIGTEPNSWKWSTTGETINSQYHFFGSSAINFKYASQECIFIMNDGKWNDHDCATSRTVLCYKDNGLNPKTYVYNSTAVTWKDAQAYCRQTFTDLAAITSSEEKAMAMSAMPNSSNPWIGLYRVPWLWSDKTPVSFTNWRPGSPNNYNGNQHCVTELSNHQWEDDWCGHNLAFICHEVLRAKTSVKIRMKTSANLTIPSSKDQILTKIRESLESRGWTVKLLLRIQKQQD